MARWFANEIFLNQYIMFGDAINDNARANPVIERTGPPDAAPTPNETSKIFIGPTPSPEEQDNHPSCLQNPEN